MPGSEAKIGLFCEVKMFGSLEDAIKIVEKMIDDVEAEVVKNTLVMADSAFAERLLTLYRVSIALRDAVNEQISNFEKDENLTKVN